MFVYQAIANALIDSGVRTLFGLMGDANLYTVDSFVRDHGGRYVYATHEANAVLMALGYAEVTGGVGVATVTHGPGLINSLAPLIEGVRGRTPSVILCGEVPATETPLTNRQSVAQREFILGTGAGLQHAPTAETVCAHVTAAFRRAATECRPIVLNIPTDLQWRETVYRRDTRPYRTDRRPAARDNDFDNAIGIIAAARKPIVLAGRGARDAESRQSLVRLAERIGAPVATTIRANGLFSGHAHNIGLFGTLSSDIAVETITEADCIVSFGAALSHHTIAGGAIIAGKRIIQVNRAAGDIGGIAEPTIGVVGDPALTAELMIHWLDEAGIASSRFADDELADRISAFSLAPELERKPTRPGTVDFRKALLAVEKSLPANRSISTDVGRFMKECWTVLSVDDPMAFVPAANFGAMGMSVASAIGAAIGAPDRPALAVCGDGGFMLGGVAEFSTAVRERLDLVVLVCNDGGYGAEHRQFRSKDMDVALSQLEWPDFAPLADALGGRGITVRNASDLDALEHNLAKRDRPVLIDLRIDPDCIPWL